MQITTLQEALPYYLGTGLKCEVLREEDLRTIVELTASQYMLYLDDYHFEFKPHFRPLSSLTKPIKVDGRKFIPAQVLWSVEASEEEAFEVYGAVPEYWKFQVKQDYKDREFRDIQLLTKWHINVFNLPADMWVEIKD